jgi:SAM-dependent methyltransferase
MAEGRHGYNVSVGYLANFFPQAAPDWLDLCIRAQGFEPRRTDPSYRYADLGCGTGFHLCLLAAANPEAEFVGIDFDSDVLHGQELAEAAGLTNVRFIQADFLDLAANWPAELGTFDYLLLQGILTWVSPDVRSAALQCVAQASRPGTVALVGYNTPPGWLPAMPFQHVANQFGRHRDANAAIGGAISMFRRLKDANAPLFERMPYFKTHLELVSRQPPSYLAHEYLPEAWAPLWHSDLAEQFRAADFSYAGPATIAEALLPDTLPPELRAIVREQPDSALRQDVQDIVIMQQFRRDIFCRELGTARSGPLDHSPIYLLSAPPKGEPVQFRTTFGGLTVEYEIVADIVAALGDDGPKPFAELMALKNPARLNTRSILFCMLDAEMLTVGRAAPASAEVAERFNAAVAARAASGKPFAYLAAAAVGSGVFAPELNLLMLDAWLSTGRRNEPEQIAREVAQRIAALGRQVQFRGQIISDEQLQPHFAGLAPVFVEEVVPQWRRLGVIQ